MLKRLSLSFRQNFERSEMSVYASSYVLLDIISISPSTRGNWSKTATKSSLSVFSIHFAFPLPFFHVFHCCNHSQKRHDLCFFSFLSGAPNKNFHLCLDTYSIMKIHMKKYIYKEKRGDAGDISNAVRLILYV